MNHGLGVWLAVGLSIWHGCGNSGDGDRDQSDLGDQSAKGDAGAGGLGAQADARVATDAATDAALTPRLDAASETARDAGTMGPTRDARAARSDAQVAPGADAQAGAGARDGGSASGPSSGCGKTSSADEGAFTTRTLRVGSGERTYHLFVPEGYQATRRYPLIFRFHGRTGNGLSGGLDIEQVARNDMLVVAPDGLDTTWSPSDTDLQLFDALLAAVGGEFCVDLGRVHAYGFSAGAGFTSLLSCARGDVLRAVAAVEGFEWASRRTCTGPAAAWLLHDSSDEAAPIAGGRAMRDRLLRQNGCAEESEPAGEDCVRYRGCLDGHPVVWCETQGRGHDIRGDYAPAEVWKFFMSLP